MGKDTIKILQAQMLVAADTKDPAAYRAAALREAEKACREGAERGADLVTLPEMFCCPYESSYFPAYAEPEDGETAAHCAEMAAEYGIYLSAGSLPEKDEEGRVYNTAIVFDRGGKRIARHRKVHLFDIDVEGGQKFRESDTLTAGDRITVFETEFGVLGLAVCFDFRFPELGRLMAQKGARLVLVPAAFNMTTGPAHWELMFRAQAMFNQYFAVGTAPALNEAATYHSWGHSIAVDPWGSVIAQMELEEGYQFLDLDLCETERIRGELPLMNGRRTDLYRLEMIR